MKNDDEVTSNEEILKALAEASSKLKGTNAFQKALANRRYNKTFPPIKIPIHQSLAFPKPISEQAFEHVLRMSVSGAAGETKEVSITPSTADRLLLFRSGRLVATDTSVKPGYGTSVALDPERTLYNPERETWHMSDYARSFDNLALHPRESFTVKVTFKETCEWKCRIIGVAQEVPNEGVYATQISATACERTFHEEIVDGKTIGIDTLRGWSRCNECYRVLREHKNWPWRESAMTWDGEIAEKKTRDFAFDADSRLILLGANAYYGGGYNRDQLRTPGITVRGNTFTSRDDDKFDLYFNDESRVQIARGDSFSLSVTNTGPKRKYKGHIVMMSAAV